MATDGEVTIIIQSLERISDRLDRHDDKFDGIVETLQQLVKIDTEQRELRGSLERAFKRIDTLEHTHNEHGCPMFREMEKKLGDTLKQLETDKANLTERLKNWKINQKTEWKLWLKPFLELLQLVFTHLLFRILKGRVYGCISRMRKTSTRV